MELQFENFMVSLELIQRNFRLNLHLGQNLEKYENDQKYTYRKKNINLVLFPLKNVMEVGVQFIYYTLSLSLRIPRQ